MTYEEMGFKQIRDNSAGYQVAFENHLPAGYGSDSPDADERQQNSADDELNDSSTPLCRAADGMLYKVVGNKDTVCRVWARAELVPDRGERLKRFRTAYHYQTQEMLADQSGIPKPNISRWENGDRDIANATGSVLLRLAKALGVTIEELVS